MHKDWKLSKRIHERKSLSIAHGSYGYQTQLPSCCYNGRLILPQVVVLGSCPRLSWVVRVYDKRGRLVKSTSPRAETATSYASRIATDRSANIYVLEEHRSEDIFEKSAKTLVYKYQVGDTKGIHTHLTSFPLVSGNTYWRHFPWSAEIRVWRHFLWPAFVAMAMWTW